MMKLYTINKFQLFLWNNTGPEKSTDDPDLDHNERHS
jgi:hypothetical protein